MCTVKEIRSDYGSYQTQFSQARVPVAHAHNEKRGGGGGGGVTTY